MITIAEDVSEVVVLDRKVEYSFNDLVWETFSVQCRRLYIGGRPPFCRVRVHGDLCIVPFKPPKPPFLDRAITYLEKLQAKHEASR